MPQTPHLTFTRPLLSLFVCFSGSVISPLLHTAMLLMADKTSALELLQTSHGSFSAQGRRSSMHSGRRRSTLLYRSAAAIIGIEQGVLLYALRAAMSKGPWSAARLAIEIPGDRKDRRYPWAVQRQDHRCSR